MPWPVFPGKRGPEWPRGGERLPAGAGKATPDRGLPAGTARRGLRMRRLQTGPQSSETEHEARTGALQPPLSGLGAGQARGWRWRTARETFFLFKTKMTFGDHRLIGGKTNTQLVNQ